MHESSRVPYQDRLLLRHTSTLEQLVHTDTRRNGGSPEIDLIGPVRHTDDETFFAFVPSILVGILFGTWSPARVPATAATSFGDRVEFLRRTSHKGGRLPAP
jgi:hypothetical protein